MTPIRFEVGTEIGILTRTFCVPQVPREGERVVIGELEGSVESVEWVYVEGFITGSTAGDTTRAPSTTAKVRIHPTVPISGDYAEALAADTAWQWA